MTNWIGSGDCPSKASAAARYRRLNGAVGEEQPISPVATMFDSCLYYLCYLN